MKNWCVNGKRVSIQKLRERLKRQVQLSTLPMSREYAQTTIRPYLGTKGREPSDHNNRKRLLRKYDLCSQCPGATTFHVDPEDSYSCHLQGISETTDDRHQQTGICDRWWSPHTSGKTSEKYVESLNGRLKLFILPPYSPHLNPDETLWAHVKREIGRKTVNSLAEMRSHALGGRRRWQKTPRRIQSFFDQTAC